MDKVAVRSAFVSLLLALGIRPAPAKPATTAAAIDALIQDNFLDRASGTLRTVNGVDPPRALEATPIYTALYLDTLLLRGDVARAREIFAGLEKLAQISRIPGFIARGIYPDGKRYYGDPSFLDYAVLHYGMWRYFNSPQATAAEKDQIRAIIRADLKQLEEHGFNIFDEVDDPTSLHELDYPGPMESEHLLAILLAGAQITGDPHWHQLYERKLHTRLEGMRRYDRGIPHNAWAMHRSLLSLTVLEKLETERQRREIFREGIRSATGVAEKQAEVFRQYLEWKRNNPDAVRLSQQPVANPIMVPLFSAHEVIRYWHNGGPMPEFETAPPHRLVWYSAESFAAVMLAGDEVQAEKAAVAGSALLESVDFRDFRDVRPLVAALCGYWRGRQRGLFTELH